MRPRFICPYCHSPIDPLAMDVASDAGAEYRICPVCDRPVVLALPDTPQPVWIALGLSRQRRCLGFAAQRCRHRTRTAR